MRCRLPAAPLASVRAPLALLHASLTNSRRSTVRLGATAAAALLAAQGPPTRRALATTTAADGRTTLESLIDRYRLVSAEAPAPDNIFKRILEGSAPADKVDDDGDLFTFRDIRPASTVHLLVIPKRFVRDASQLAGATDAELVRRMRRKAIERVRIEVGPDAFDESELALGFHWPPWYSVPWLHLHAIYPRREMRRRYKYTVGCRRRARPARMALDGDVLTHCALRARACVRTVLCCAALLLLRPRPRHRAH